MINDGHRFFTEQEAAVYYNTILESFQDSGTQTDKANRLRSIFDCILRDAINKKYGGMPPADKLSGFGVMIDDLFGGNSHEDEKCRSELHYVRSLLNPIQHSYKKGKTIKEIQERQKNHADHSYNICLREVSRLVETLSGTSIIEKLLQASKRLSKGTMKCELEIVLLVELFDTLANVEKGNFVLREINKMIREKDRIGLDKLKIHLVTYSSSFNCISPIYHHSDMKYNESRTACANPANEGLTKALELLNAAVDHYISKNTSMCDKPWFIWLCSSLRDGIDPELINKLHHFVDVDCIGFYPIAMDSEKTFQDFEKLLPNCGPKIIDYKLSGNMFKSILETVQHMHKGHRIIKAKKT